MRYESISYCILTIHPLGEYTYSLDCTFFRIIRLTAIALHRMAMCGFLVGTTEPEKSTLKRVQLRIPE
jgi:hypothetical protein